MKIGISTFVTDDGIDTVSLARAIEEAERGVVVQADVPLDLGALVLALALVGDLGPVVGFALVTTPLEADASAVLELDADLVLFETLSHAASQLRSDQRGRR